MDFINNQSVPRKIYFVYRRSQSHLGSIEMRARQFSATLSKLGIRTDLIPIFEFRNRYVELLWCSRLEPGSVAVFIKDAMTRLTKNGRGRLAKKNISVMFDVLDLDINRFDYEGIDTIITSSSRQYKYFNSLKQTNRLNLLHVMHQPDIRLEENENIKKTRKICYYGEHMNIYLPTEYLSKVDILNYTGKMENEDIKNLSQYEFNYCIRGPQQNTSLFIFKPITKIMNSIQLNSLPIISFDMDDAVELLGKEYPFILSSYSKKGFSDLFKKTNSTDHINKGMMIIKKLRKETSSNFISKDFLKGLYTK